MGNVEAHDFAPVRADERNVLNLGRKVTPKQYVRHLNGQPHEVCLTEIPWSVRDSVCLYEKMTVAFNSISEIPVELPLRLPHLSCLHLNHNQITTLPESFGLFFHLKEIQLQHNKLSHLPDSFVHLVKLEKIDLSYNELRSLHKDMGNMERLKKLNVIHNKLEELPVSLGSPSCLINVLLAHQNRLEKPPQAICDEGSQSALQCLRKIYSSIKLEVKPPPVNVFPRCCGNRSESSVSNPHSAQIQYIQEQTNTLHTTNRIKAPLLPPPGSSCHTPFVLQDKIIGLIYGAAIGDAIGVSCLWMSDDEVQFHYGAENEELEYDKIVQDEHRVLWRQGDWTSNFDQLMLVLESLVSWGGVVDELEFARRLKAWASNGFSDLGDTYGVLRSLVLEKVISHPSFTEDPHSSATHVIQEKKTLENGTCNASNNGVENSPPSSPCPRPHARLRRLSSSSLLLSSLSICNHVEVAQKLVYTGPSSHFGEDNAAVVRSSILGVPNFHECHEVEGNALRICRTTHAHPKCIASCIVVSSIISLLLKGNNSELQTGNDTEFSEQIDKIFNMAADYLTGDEVKREFCSLRGMTDISSFDAREPERICHTYKLVQVAVIALMWDGDYKSLISQVTRMGGDSSSNACMAGAIMGCRTGYANLPAHWLTGLRKRQVIWLNSRVNHLLDIMGSP